MTPINCHGNVVLHDNRGNNEKRKKQNGDDYRRLFLASCKRRIAAAEHETLLQRSEFHFFHRILIQNRWLLNWRIRKLSLWRL